MFTVAAASVPDADAKPAPGPPSSFVNRMQKWSKEKKLKQEHIRDQVHQEKEQKFAQTAAQKHARMQKDDAHKRRNSLLARRAGRVALRDRMAGKSTGKSADQTASALASSTTAEARKARMQALKLASAGHDSESRWADQQAEGFRHWINHALHGDVGLPDMLRAGPSAAPSSTDTSATAAAGGGGASAATESTATAAAARGHMALIQAQHTLTLRSRALQLYDSDELSAVRLKTGQMVVAGRICVRKDKQLPADVGMQKELLNCLSQYHPAWLKIGLETVFGCTIGSDKPVPASAMPPRSVIVGLRRWMKSHLVVNEDIKAKHKDSVGGLFSSEYIHEQHCFTLQSILQLVLFLDRYEATYLPSPFPLHTPTCRYTHWHDAH